MYLQRCIGKVGLLSENTACPFLLFFEHYASENQKYTVEMD